MAGIQGLQDLGGIPLPSSLQVQLAQVLEQVGAFNHPNYRDWDFGLIGGAEMVVGRSGVRGNLEIRYERRFVDLLPNSLTSGATNGIVSGVAGVQTR